MPGGNKPDDGSRSKKKTTANKYISVEEVERIKETLKTCIKNISYIRSANKA